MEPEEIIAPPVVEPEIEAPPIQPQAAPIDYDQIINGVTERLRPQAAPQDPDDPYASVAENIFTDTPGALKSFAETITRQTLSAVAPYLQPVAQNYAMTQITKELQPDEAAEAQAFIQQQGIDHSGLTSPAAQQLIRSHAKVLAAEKRGDSYRKNPPSVEGGPGMSVNIDGETQRELDQLKGLYSSLGIDFKPAELLKKVRA